MAGQEPALAQSDPKAYYLWLQTQGLSPLQAVQQVQQRFGAPKSPEEQQKELADQQFKQSLAQTGGVVGGAVIANQIGSLFAGGGSAAAPAVPNLIGAKVVTAAPATTAAPASTLSTLGSVGLPAAAIIAGLSETWEGGMKDIIRGRGNKQDWTNMGVNAVGGVGPNLVLRWMGKPSLGRMMTSGKSDAQLLRDDFRGLLKQTGVADDDYNVTLADGSQFNIGLDGKTKYQNVGENIDKKKTRNAWDVDFSNPLAEFAVKQINPMIQNIYKGADGKLNLEQYTGMLVNAATSNAKSQDDVIANINAMLGKSTFAKEAGVKLPDMPKGRQVAPVAKTPQVSTPEGKEKSMSIRERLELNTKKK